MQLSQQKIFMDWGSLILNAQFSPFFIIFQPSIRVKLITTNSSKQKFPQNLPMIALFREQVWSGILVMVIGLSGVQFGL